MNQVSLNISPDEEDFTGNGMELLMNNTYKGKNTGNGGGDIEDLEKELNDLSEIQDIGVAEPMNQHHYSEPDVRFNEKVSVGEYTSNMGSNVGNMEKSWDGYGQYNDIPQEEKMSSGEPPPQMSKEDILREKFKYLRLLDKFSKKGVTVSKTYTMESSLMEMKGECEMIIEDTKKDNSTKLMGNALMMFIKGIEYLNNRFDPFEIDLDGLGEQISENITDYDDVFGELHEKYKTSASIAPELRFIFQLGGSAALVHMTNTMFKTAAPGVDDLMRQNPELARQFQAAAVNSMSTSNPGLSNFMNSNVMPGPEPKPIPTQGRYSAQIPPGRGGNNVDRSAHRPEMKGPSDLDELLSGLKTQTRTINVEDENVISADDARSLQSDTNAPKRSRRKPKSEKNTVSVSI